MAHPTPLRPTPDGNPHEPYDVLNHLAAWLEPRRVSIATSELMQRFFESTLMAIDVDERELLSPAELRWARESLRSN